MWLNRATILILLGMIMMLPPLVAASDPIFQSESAEQQKAKGALKPGETKMGIAPSPFQPDSAKSKGGSKPGETKMGIAIED